MSVPEVCSHEIVFASKIVLLLLRREKRVHQMSAVAGDAGEQTLISISTADAVERPRSVTTISESMASSKERLQTHSIIR